MKKITQADIDKKVALLEAKRKELDTIISTTNPVKEEITKIQKDIMSAKQDLKAQKITIGTCLYDPSNGSIMRVLKKDKTTKEFFGDITFGTDDNRTDKGVNVRSFKYVVRTGGISIQREHFTTSRYHNSLQEATIIPVKLYKKVENCYNRTHNDTDTVVKEFEKLKIPIRLK